MVAIATGLWWDHSKATILAATLTLPLHYGNLLLSGLTILVTIAGSSFWNIVAFFLHNWKAKSESPSAIDLQHQVSLRNSAGATQTLWEALKIHHAWSNRRSKQLLQKTCAVAVPALLVSAGFAVAAIFTSRVANKAHGTVIARAKPENCGVWSFNVTSRSDMLALNAMGAKMQNDVRRARSHVANFYANTSSSAARSAFMRPTLPYSISTSAPCPIPAADRCILGPNKAFSIATDFLDSHEMLGINAKFEDRISVQLSLTCSPVYIDDLTEETGPAHSGTVKYFLGPMQPSTDYTYKYNKARGNSTAIGYIVESVPSFGTGPLSQNSSLWEPIPDFSRDDADISVHFLSHNDLLYMAPVYDPWFSANGTRNFSAHGVTVYAPDRVVNTMACADQYVFCNPSTASCTSPSGVHKMIEKMTWNSLDFSATQLFTASRILTTLLQSNTYNTVSRLGPAALWANDMAIGPVSYGLPENQWQTEVIGWFQTNLAMIQGHLVNYVSNPADLGPSGFILKVEGPEHQNQCTNQLIQAAGEVQNFSVCGMMIIVCVSALLVLLDCLLERVVDFVGSFRGRDLIAREARQADNKLHLLRMALGGDKWELGQWDIPVSDGAAQFNRPTGMKELVSYQDSTSGEATGGLQEHK